MTKKILKSTLILLAVLILVLLGLYFIPPKQQIVEYDYSNSEKNSLINSKVGWYTTENAKNYQVTWGAKQGLQLNYFDFNRHNLKSLKLTHIKDNAFDTDGNRKTIEVEFKPRKTDSLLTIDVKTSKTEFIAVKRDSFFYDQEEIEYFNGEDRLAALLLTPYEKSKSTAIVFIHGSGVSDRDNFWYMHQAHYLASNGFMVLLPDKRGCGKSTGSWHTASFNDFANDITAALDYLSANKQSEFNKKGVVGISQGGWISHLVNEMNDDLDFVVDVVSSATSPNEQVKYEVMQDIRNSGAPKFLANPLSVIFAKRAKGRRKIWWEKNGDFDPVPLMSGTTIPILKIFGDEDENVPVKRSQELIDELMKERPDLPLEVKIFEGVGHGLFDKETNWIREDYLDFLNAWMSKI